MQALSFCSVLVPEYLMPLSDWLRQSGAPCQRNPPLWCTVWLGRQQEPLRKPKKRVEFSKVWLSAHYNEYLLHLFYWSVSLFYNIRGGEAYDKQYLASERRKYVPTRQGYINLRSMSEKCGRKLVEIIFYSGQIKSCTKWVSLTWGSPIHQILLHIWT